MNAVATTVQTKTKKPTAAPPPKSKLSASTAPDAGIPASLSRPTSSPALMTGEQHWDLTLKFDRAEAILDMLVHLFGGDSGIDEPSTADGLLGTLQHLDQLLTEAHMSIMEIDGPLPDDLRWRTFEAHSLVSMLEAMVFADDCKWRMSDGVYSGYLDAANQALRRAAKALSSTGSQQMHDEIAASHGGLDDVAIAPCGNPAVVVRGGHAS